MKIRFITFLIFLTIFSACKNNNLLRIEGTFKNAEKKYIFINRVDVDTPVFIDSVKIRSDGSFKYKLKTTETEFYQIGFTNTDFITLLAEPGENIKLKFNGKLLYNDYEVNGSAGSQKIQMLDSALSRTKSRIDSLKSVYEGATGKPEFAATEQAVNQKFVKILKEQRLFNINFILKNLKSLATIKALYQRIDESTYVLYDSRDLQFLKIASDTLMRYYPNSKQAKALKLNFEKELSRMELNKIYQLSKDIPETRLDPALKDVNGKIIRLSSLQGKYILLTFWSSASGDCLSENLELKNLYKKYKSSGFEIYQINLDLNEEVWKKAVNYDELPWISVREDDPLRPHYAQLYNVKVLPANYLYDRTGNIIGANLHGKALQLKLTQLFGN
jgi:thiol-disulfide isomerase/thioredoxin